MKDMDKNSSSQYSMRYKVSYHQKKYMYISTRQPSPIISYYTRV